MMKMENGQTIDIKLLSFIFLKQYTENDCDFKMVLSITQSNKQYVYDYSGGLFWAYWYLRGLPILVSTFSLTKSTSACATAVRS